MVLLRFGKFGWIENFIMNYGKKLFEIFRENMFMYNLVQLYFYEKKYNKVIEQLQFVEYIDVIYNINLKLMLIVIYYEFEEIEFLYYLLDSFKVYLNRYKDIVD